MSRDYVLSVWLDEEPSSAAWENVNSLSDRVSIASFDIAPNSPFARLLETLRQDDLSPNTPKTIED